MYTEVPWPVTNNLVYNFSGANLVLLQSFYFPSIFPILASSSLLLGSGSKRCHCDFYLNFYHYAFESLPGCPKMEGPKGTLYGEVGSKVVVLGSRCGKLPLPSSCLIVREPSPMLPLKLALLG